MAPPLQNFVQLSGVVNAPWLNIVDVLVTTVFNQAQTNPAARAALFSDAPLEIVNGGTGQRTAAAGLANLGGLAISAVTQNYLSTILYPQTAAELAAGITPANYTAAAGNIIRYGADPTGVTSSLSALQQAIAQQRAGGVGVTAPAGTFNLSVGLVDSPLTAQNGLRITGAGKTATTFFSSGPVVLNFAGPLYEDVFLADFGIGGISANQISGVGIQFSAIRGGNILRNISIYGNPVTGTATGFFFLGLVSGTYTGEFEIEDCVIYNCQVGVAFNGICTGGAIKYTAFINGAVIAGSVGVSIANTCTGQLLVGNQFGGYAAAGVVSSGTVLRQLGNNFTTGTPFIWTRGAGNGFCGNFSCGDIFGAGTPAYPVDPTDGCVVLGPLTTGVGAFFVAGSLQASSSAGIAALGLFGAAPTIGPQSGWGNPTGGSVVANYPGASATLLQTSAALAELLAYLKAVGILST